MIYCSQCGSCDDIFVQRIDTSSPTLMQMGDHEWAEQVPKEDMPMLEFWCAECHHVWEMAGTLKDVLAGRYDEEEDEE